MNVQGIPSMPWSPAGTHEASEARGEAEVCYEEEEKEQEVVNRGAPAVFEQGRVGGYITPRWLV